MAATVHSLFASAAPEVRAPADGLRTALRDGCVEILDDLARQMLDSADDALFKMSETAGSDSERRQFFDTMRVLRLDRALFSEQLSRAVGETFEPCGSEDAAAAPIAELSIQTTEALEERIAVGNLAARIENQYGPSLLDLHRRLDGARARGAAIPATALTAASLCAAFGTAMSALRTEFEIKLIVYKLFERVLCRDFERLLRHGVETLQRHGFEAGVSSAAARPAPARQPSRTTAQAPAADPEPTGPTLPDSTRALLNLLLARLSSNPMIAAAQRVQASRTLPAPMAELLQMATELGSDRQAASRLDAALESALAMTEHGNVASGTEALQRVIDSLRGQLREQRQRLLRQVRGEVGRELDLRIAGRDLPPPLLTLLRSGIGPLMAMRLLDGGRDSAAFGAADALLDRLLDSLDTPRPPNEEDQRRRVTLLVELRAALLGVGMSEARAGQLIDGLIASWALCDAQLPEMPMPDVPKLDRRAATPPAVATPLPAASPELLARVLLPDTWFRVFDAARNQTRWLKVASYYADEDLVRFTGIDDSTQLSLRASRLGSDLVDGRSEPVSPSPDTRAALDALRRDAMNKGP